MFVVVCYDIPEDRRRNRVGKLLEGFGNRAQRSVFECDLTPRQLATLKKRLSLLVEPAADSLRYYTLCGQCQGRVELVGVGPPVEGSPLYYVV